MRRSLLALLLLPAGLGGVQAEESRSALMRVDPAAWHAPARPDAVTGDLASPATRQALGSRVIIAGDESAATLLRSDSSEPPDPLMLRWSNEELSNGLPAADRAAALVMAPPSSAQWLVAGRVLVGVPRPALSPRPVRQAALPEPPSGYPVAVGQSFRDCDECPELVVIPAGSFVMGSPRSESGRSSTEGPQREVVLSHPLAVGKYEVTFGEWDACDAAGWCRYRPDSAGWGRGRHPVMRVSWEDAQEYVNWLSRRTGRSYRLLTEAEWEYAARAGTTTAYSFGQTVSPSQANYGENVRRTQAVGSYPANHFGLHDMHGNVAEWVQDCWRTSYAGAPPLASQPVLSGGCTQRVLRGGSWGSAPRYLRAAHRSGLAPSYRQYIIGFRVARMPG